MSDWLIALTGIIYLVISVDLYFKGKTGLAIAYFGYAFANIGLYMEATKSLR